jgi:PAS domain S-box-containing protein
MKLLITGGTGFIGSRLSVSARAAGHDIVVIGLTNTPAESDRLEELRTLGIDVRIGSLQDPAFVRSALEGCDAVIHLAAAQHEANVPDDYFRKVNVEGTRILLNECMHAGVKRFVYGSTIGVYGSASTAALDEDSPTRPTNIYGITKLEAENLVRSHADRLDITVIRISETYGPGDLRLLKLFKAVQSGWFAMIGDGLNRRQPIHVQDLVRGLLLAVEHPAAIGQTLLLAGPKPLTTREMVRDVAAALNRPLRNIGVPMWPMWLAAQALEHTLKPLGIQPPLHRRRLDFFRTSFWFSIAKAKRLIGFEPMIPFAVGARDTAGWYRREGLLEPAPAGVGSSGMSDTLLIEPKGDVPLASFDAERWDLADILEYTHDAIIIWEMDGAGILYWNRAAEQLYGYSRQEAVGRTTHALLRTEVSNGVQDLEAKLARYGVWVGTLRHRCRDGTHRVVETRLALMSQRGGRWLVLEVNRDRTEQNEALAAAQSIA